MGPYAGATLVTGLVLRTRGYNPDFGDQEGCGMGQFALARVYAHWAPSMAASISAKVSMWMPGART